MDDNNFVMCHKCNTNVLKKCEVIHSVACNSKPKPKKEKGFFESLFSSEQKQDQGPMIPCTQCGESFPFQIFAMHQSECVGHQVTMCNQCKILFPTFLFEDHLNVCEGPKAEHMGLEEEEPAPDNILYNMISQMAVEQAQKEKFTDDPLTEIQLKKLDQTSVKVEEDCSICCCPMLKKNRQINLNCKHIFHKNCITSWLRKNPLCPMCRQHALQK